MNRWRILTGDVRERLADVDDASVQTCITSPPYWGLRDYGTASWEGGDPSCQHRVSGQVQDSKAPGAITTGQRPGVDASRCRECGAIRRDCQIGLEKTPDAYVSELVAVFREVRRVLRDDGTLWLNLGDSYASNGGAHGGRDDNQTGVGAKRIHAAGAADQAPRRAADGLKPKDLVGIPWRVAFALQADGWWLRQDIIWHKPNPMPESVTDRCTKAHEYVFLLTKSARYYYDAEAVKEAFADERMGNPRGGGHYAREAFAHVSPHAQSGLQKGEWNTDGGKTGRNKRSVWTVSTSPYSGAHFAVMPEALVEPCVRAGCRTDDVVLDPFTGSGTVGAVALRLGRSFLGCELNPAYVALAEQRLRSVAPLFALEGA